MIAKASMGGLERKDPLLYTFWQRLKEIKLYELKCSLEAFFTAFSTQHVIVVLDTH